MTDYQTLYDNGTCSIYSNDRNGMIYFGFNFYNDGQPLFYREWNFDEAVKFADNSKAILDMQEASAEA